MSEKIDYVIEGAKLDGMMEAVDHIETRACDPWDDSLWPAANTVLMAIAKELREEIEQLHEYFTEQLSKEGA